jgi:hypothetical protein
MIVLAFARAIALALATVGVLLSSVRPAAPQDQPSLPISVHIAARTAFIHTDTEDAGSSDEFVLDSVRLFLSGPVTDRIKLSFNTEYDTVTNRVRVMDAIGQFEYSPGVNFWVGRFLPPSDRANLYGPYFSNHWAIYTDGIQDGYPFVSDGRANGAMYWGQFGKVSLSGGVFDGRSMTPRTTPVEGGRVQVDFWDAEPGYYSSGTYYGAKNVLALGAAGQVQGADNRAMSLDALVERKVGTGGAVTFEGEFARYHRLGGYSARYGMDQGGYALAAYLLPMTTGPGRFQLLGKIARASFSEGITPADPDYRQTTTELNLNYVLKAFDARVMAFYLDTRFSAVRPDVKRIGVGIQLQK